MLRSRWCLGSMVVLLLFFSISLSLCAATAKGAADSPAKCDAVPSPIIRLAEQSVYEANDPSQSHINLQAAASYQKRSAPLWDFVRYSAKYASLYVNNNDVNSAQCALTAMKAWADAGALTQLLSRSSQLNMGRNLSGIVLSYKKVRSVATESQRVAIERWLLTIGKKIPEYFIPIEKTKTALGNLRYWNGLAAAAIGDLVGDEELLKWGMDSYHAGMCQVDQSGALPIEMHRAGRALAYQLYATAPLVALAEIMKSHDLAPEKECNGALQRLVNFSIASSIDVSAVEKKSGSKQVIGPYKILAGWHFAWIDIYQRNFGPIAAIGSIKVTRPLLDPFLGGDTTRRTK